VAPLDAGGGYEPTTTAVALLASPAVINLAERSTATADGTGGADALDVHPEAEEVRRTARRRDNRRRRSSAGVARRAERTAWAHRQGRYGRPGPRAALRKPVMPSRASSASTS